MESGQRIEIVYVKINPDSSWIHEKMPTSIKLR